MIALKALADSTPLAWVKVATVTLFSLFEFAVMGADTTMAGSATEVLAAALLLAELGSAALLVTEAELVRLPSSSAWAVTVSVAWAPLRMPPRLKVTVLPDWVNEP